MKTFDHEIIAARWTRLGAMFMVEPSTELPDVEHLLLDTVRTAGENTRFFIMAASWLALYGDYVAKRRLAVLVRDQLEPMYRPRMGFLLEWAQEHGHRNRRRFRETIVHCQPSAQPQPLASVSRQSAVLRELAQQRASALSRRWGCWMEEFEIKANALRPPEWIARENPSLRVRALAGGDLVATIAADAAAGIDAFASESELARRYKASRSAVRDALWKLKLAGFVRQTRVGREHAIAIKTPALTR